MRVLVVGAGAVGGYFGGRLAEAERDVTFLVHAQRASSIRKEGLQILSPHGNAILHPKVVQADEITAPYDLILLSVKAYALDAAMKDFAAAVGTGTMILPVLNGLRHIELLVPKFGEDPVIGGVCQVATEIDDEGRIVQLSEVQQLIYGERNGVMSQRMKALDNTMQGAHFEARISEDIVQEMWKKWIQLLSIGAATCLMRGNIGEIESVPGGADVSLRILEECVAIASACGHEPSESFVTRTRSAMTAHGSGLTSSMYRDLSTGNRVEVDHILGDLLERGRKAGITAPLVQSAFVNLRIYQARLGAK